MAKFNRLSLEERKTIEKLLDEGKNVQEIAFEIKRSKGGISCEISRNGGQRFYNAEKAQERTDRIKKEANKDKFSPMQHLTERVKFLEEQMKLLMESNVLR
jgi:IS30 family transposase